jgi:hypothetical protein
MSYAAGYDHREFLPPFLPVYRNEDGTMHEVLRAMFGSVYVAHLPWAVWHEPPPRRWKPEAALRDAAGTCVSYILDGVIRLLTAGNVKGTAALGSRLKATGALARKEFEPFVREIVCDIHASRIRRLEELLERYGGNPPYWERDVRSAIQLMNQRLTDHEFIRLAEAPHRWSESVELLRTVARLYGALLEKWETILQTSRMIQADGHGLARRLGPS